MSTAVSYGQGLKAMATWSWSKTEAFVNAVLDERSDREWHAQGGTIYSNENVRAQTNNTHFKEHPQKKDTLLNTADGCSWREKEKK